MLSSPILSMGRCAVFAVNAVFAIGSILTVGAGIPFVALYHLFLARPPLSPEALTSREVQL